MPWSVEHNERDELIEIEIVGDVVGPGLRELTSKAIALVADTGVTRIIIDASEQEQTGSITDLYDLPNQYTEEGLDRRIRAAMIVPNKPGLEELAEFYETVCVNRGWHLRNFRSMDGALDWLKPPGDGSAPA